MLKKTLLIATIFALIFSLGLSVFAKTETIEEITPDVTEQDLEIKGTSWFYNAWREIKIAFTRDPIKKSELQLQKASAQLLRTKLRLEKNPDNEKTEIRLEKANERYNRLVEKINTRIVQIQENNPDKDRLNKFLDKYSDHLLKHQEIMQKLETQVPEDVSAKINARRMLHLEKFSNTMQRLEGKQQFAERLKKALQTKTKNNLRRAVHYGIIKELQNTNPQIKTEIKDKMIEVKTENREIWNQIQEDRKQIIQNRVQIRTDIKK